MDMNLLQSTLDIVFRGHLLYLAPFLFLMMVILFADRLIELITTSMQRSSSRRRY
ncbi:hypothetical protein [Lentibacillus cibarius]|uniref:hypothetical protein n=1 Tax=Lentibacillus cibarius TaxID=2583219 RepID=UPI00163DCD40|nr:hypothetical protein [Lentibacillus cibarius]